MVLHYGTVGTTTCPMPRMLPSPWPPLRRWLRPSPLERPGGKGSSGRLGWAGRRQLLSCQALPQAPPVRRGLLLRMGAAGRAWPLGRRGHLPSHLLSGAAVACAGVHMHTAALHADKYTRENAFLMRGGRRACSPDCWRALCGAAAGLRAFADPAGVPLAAAWNACKRWQSFSNGVFWSGWVRIASPFSWSGWPVPRSVSHAVLCRRLHGGPSLAFVTYQVYTSCNGTLSMLTHHLLGCPAARPGGQG